MQRDCGGKIWERRVESVNGGWRGDCHCLTVDEGGGGRRRGLRREKSSCPHRQFAESRSRSKSELTDCCGSKTRSDTWTR